MNFETYLPLALRTAPPDKGAWEDLTHCLFGLTTEIGEFASEVKRNRFYGTPYSEAAIANMKKELGDICWYVCPGVRGLHSAYPSQLSAAAEKNVRDTGATLEGCVELFAMFTGAFAVEFHAERYVQGCSYTQMGRALVGILGTIERAAALLGTTGDAVRSDNIAKLRKRFPEGFSGEAAEARADVGGLGHRES